MSENQSYFQINDDSFTITISSSQPFEDSQNLKETLTNILGLSFQVEHSVPYPHTILRMARLLMAFENLKEEK